MNKIPIFIIILLFQMILLSQAPNPPTDLQATSGTDVIVLTWQPPIDETTYHTAYKIYRNGNLIAGNYHELTRPAFIDINQSPGVVYVYFVTAVNIELNTESLPSNAVSVETKTNTQNPQLNLSTPNKIQSSQKFPKFQKGQWKVSMNMFYESTTKAFWSGGWNDEGSFELKSKRVSFYPEILYKMSFNKSYSWDTGMRIYFTSSLGDVVYGFSEPKTKYMDPYLEIYNQFRKEQELLYWIYIIPYVEPRAIIDDGIYSFLLLGSDIGLGAPIRIFRLGIVTDIADIEGIQYRVGMDVHSRKGYGISVQAGFIFSPKTAQEGRFFASLGYTFK